MKRYVALVMCTLIFLFASAILSVADSGEGNESTVVYNDDGSVTVIGAESWAEASALVQQDISEKRAKAKQEYEEAVKTYSSSTWVTPVETEDAEPTHESSVPRLSDSIIDYFRDTDLAALLLSIPSSGAFGAWLAYRSEKKKGERELAMQRAEFEAAIKQKEKEFELASAQKQREWDHEKQLLESSYERVRSEQLQAAFNSMVTAVTNYMNMNDVNYKAAAEAEVRKFVSVADSGMMRYVNELDDIISRSDPFDGPNNQLTKSIINKIGVNLLK